MSSFTRQDSAQDCRWHAFAGVAELERDASKTILAAATQAIAARGEFHLVLAGGSTPRRVYAALRASNADWRHWHIYFGDERCLPAGHAERNSAMAAQAWLDHIAIPPRQVHPIPAESGAVAAAMQYAAVVGQVDYFDLVLLGLGEDGHTASLFPGHDWGSHSDSPAALPVADAPKPPPERVSLSAYRLSRARQVLFLVTGTAKQQAITDWKRGMAIPASAIAPPNGVDIYLEAALLQAGNSEP